MFKALSLFGVKKSSKPFKDFYNEWFHTLKKTILPQLCEAMKSNLVSPTLLSTHVQTMQQHVQAYYEALDLAATDDIAQVLYPEWRNNLEKPFLWFGDLHPYLFINLLRSFLDNYEESQYEEDQEEDEDVAESLISIRKDSEFFERPYDVAMAYKSPSKNLMTRVDQIECGLRLMVPALVARGKKVQMAFIESVGAAEWGRREAAIGREMTAEMEELTSVFLDANRVRRSVLAEILSVTDVYQAAVFLEGLAQFLVGFRRHKLLREFDKCKMAIT